MGGGRPPLGHHSEGTDALRNRRHRRRCDHIAARATWWRPQLGLPVLLASRCHHYALCPDELWLHMYGIAGERRLTEYEVTWLRGYEDAAPVRIGNAASDQLQLDVYGEVLDALYQARRMGLPFSEAAWDLERALLGHLETIWDQPDEG